MNIFKKLIYKYNHWCIKRILKKTALTVNPEFHIRNVMGNAYMKYMFDYSELNESEKKLLNDPEFKACYSWAKRNKDKRV